MPKRTERGRTAEARPDAAAHVRPHRPATTSPLVDVALVRDSGDAFTVVDCRFVLGDPAAGERAYRDGHIPGAAFLDLDRDLAGPPGDRGRHPLPATPVFEASARRAAISNTSSVIAYDEAGEGGAARLWWLLRHFGLDDVRVLDGGLAAWRRSDGPLAAGDERIASGDFVAAERSDDVVSRTDIAAIVAGDTRRTDAQRSAAAQTRDSASPASARAQPERRDPADGRGPTLLDARAPERFRGEVEPIDPVAGHIPGARNLPFATLAPNGRFLNPAELRDRFAAAGVTADAIAYCGSGVTASVLVLAAEVAGLPVPRLYPGSWSEWCRAEQGRH